MYADGTRVVSAAIQQPEQTPRAAGRPLPPNGAEDSVFSIDGPRVISVFDFGAGKTKAIQQPGRIPYVAVRRLPSSAIEDCALCATGTHMVCAFGTSVVLYKLYSCQRQLPASRTPLTAG